MSDFNRFEAVLVDFDGTLVDSEPIHYEANRLSFEHIGHQIDEIEYYLHWSLLGEGFVGEIQRYNLEIEHLESLQKLSHEWFGNIVNSREIKTMPGAHALLHQLPKQFKKIAIASNTKASMVREIITRANIDIKNLNIFGYRSELRKKPAPDIFLETAQRLDVKPIDCLVLEDTLKGLWAAQRAGMHCIIIPSPRYPSIQFPGALDVFRNLNEFLKSKWMRNHE